MIHGGRGDRLATSLTLLLLMMSMWMRLIGGGVVASSVYLLLDIRDELVRYAHDLRVVVDENLHKLGGQLLLLINSFVSIRSFRQS